MTRRSLKRWIDALFVGATVLIALLIAGKHFTKSAQRIAQALKFRQLEGPLSATKKSPLFYQSIGGPPDTLPNNSDTLVNPQHQAKYSVELFICEDLGCVQAKLELLELIGLRNGFYTPAARVDGSLEYRVRHGLFQSKQGANIARKKLANTLKVDGIVVRL